ncbi:MAG: protein phosphatase 2C domain-containing protein [Gammaproteobacteria bacterium]|nr:SpoIIE family protein phosphatase [Rhodocyclaceae bacterium]MBU3908102.1 protein phosphatase 2C domain-containing protein [Gammaproteobacteria bacterium]MBU3989017.1 protein phosphatase 2C domain-containing protein [Gammaproteobacteria bacterium]MBU4005743.1 protein phosphatase 2C domain-containing protein [Gammaproteobacteria bacterium]MBU4021509.1 protein phosphatase 2C domain-containing protein [Gammaproteobacteria bacterium]
MKFSIYQDSRIGGRANNEDRLGYRYTSDTLIMVLADGMGGHGHGDLAAEAVVRSVIAAFDQQAQPRLADPYAFLVAAMADAHAAIHAQVGMRMLVDQPRTTCVICIVQDGIAIWAHAGDSRLYVLRRGRLLTRTRDHSRVQALIDDGLLAEDEARCHPARNILTGCLGGDQTPRFDLSRKTPLMSGDVVLLCSDGVWAPLDDDQPLVALSDRDAIKAAPEMLNRVESAAGPGRDNLSLIVMVWADSSRTDSAPATPNPNDPPAAPAATSQTWSDEDIDRAIETIRARIGDKET